jgi:hypothetical protein
VAKAGKTALQWLRTALACNRQAFGVTLENQHRMIHGLAVGRTVGGVEIGQHLAAHWSPRKWMNCLLKCRSGAPVEGETELW